MRLSMTPRYDSMRHLSRPVQVTGSGLNTDRVSLWSNQITLEWPIVWKIGASEFLGSVRLKGKA